MKSFSFLVSITSNGNRSPLIDAGVADLAAGLAVEWGSIEDEDQGASTVGLGCLGEPVLLEDADDACLILRLSE